MHQRFYFSVRYVLFLSLIAFFAYCISRVSPTDEKTLRNANASPHAIIANASPNAIINANASPDVLLLHIHILTLQRENVFTYVMGPNLHAASWVRTSAVATLVKMLCNPSVVEGKMSLSSARTTTMSRNDPLSQIAMSRGYFHSFQLSNTSGQHLSAIFNFFRANPFTFVFIYLAFIPPLDTVYARIEKPRRTNNLWRLLT